MAEARRIDGFFFTSAYFLKNVDQLIRLRNYLREHLEFHASCQKDCKDLRINGLGLTGTFLGSMDSSLGLVVKAFGGQSSFISKKVYYLGEPMSAIAYVHLMNVKEDYKVEPTEISKMPMERFEDLNKKLFDGTRDKPDNMFPEQLKKWCALPGEKITLAVNLIEEDLGPDLMNYFEDVCRVIRVFLLRVKHDPLYRIKIIHSQDR